MKQRSFRRTTRSLVVLAVAIGVGIVGKAVRAATPAEVNESIKKGVEYLKKIQNPSGSWEIVDTQVAPGEEQHAVTGKQWGGLTAMATYALLAAGESHQSEHVKKGINWLLDKGQPMVGTYAIGLRAQVWTFLPLQHPRRKDIANMIKRDRDLLIKGMRSSPGNADHGFYGYFPEQQGHYDRSNSQYAVLGMWAVARAGGEVPQSYWETIDKAWKKAQNADGGWEYSGETETTANMTTAGLATLFITLEYLSDQTGQCKGNAFNQEIEKALGWMDRNVVGLLSGGNFYGAYGVERIGVASGRKYFGKIDWFQVGADFLIKNQNGDGAWGAEEAAHNPKLIPNTCFSIFFLTRGRAPIVANKLEWKSVTKEGKESGWNQRQRDLANFAHWMGSNLDRTYVNWQIVNLKGNADDLHDSPILYMAGSEGFAFTKDDAEKVKRYIEDGGLLLANADCSKQNFVKSVRALCKQMFPTREFRDLPANHPIFTAQQFKAEKWKARPKVQGLSNGVREMAILIPEADPAKAWQVRSEASKAELYQLGANISLYSTGGLSQKFKGDTHIIKDLGKKPALTVRVARLLAGPNADPEPAGWRRLDNVMRNANQADLSDYDKPIKLGAGELKGFDVAHLTGTTKFKLDDKARAELKAFVADGGTLVMDAAGGHPDFFDTAEAEATAIWPDAAKKQLLGLNKELDVKHELFANPAAPIEAVEYRKFAKTRMTGKVRAPRLRGMDTTGDGRLDVFVSREDLSAGLVGQEVDGIVGYTPDSATAIMRNIILYATAGKSPAGAAPAPEVAAKPDAQPAPPQPTPANQPAQK